MNTNIHRHLDEAFAGIDLTPDIQDLKEELRGSLAARADELEASGMDATAAASTAVQELGDIRELIASLDGTSTLTGNAAADLAARNHVRPKPAFVIVAVILSLLIAAAGTLVALVATHVVDVQWWVSPVVFAIAVGALVDYSLRQETSQHYPLPSGRAAAFGLTSLAMALGLGLTGAFFGEGQIGILIAGVALVLVAIVAFTWLGVTQTNRTKPWALELQRTYAAEDRFSQDPAAAARFGIYTVVIWVMGFALFIVLSFTVGFAWSWLALIGSLVVFFLVLARMLFEVKK